MSKMAPPGITIEAIMTSNYEGNTKFKENKALAPEKSKENEALWKWCIKAGKAMDVLRGAVEDELLEYIREAATPKIAWDILATLFSKKNNSRLQLLESEL